MSEKVIPIREVPGLLVLGRESTRDAGAMNVSGTQTKPSVSSKASATSAQRETSPASATSPVVLWRNGSGIEFTTNASAVWVRFEADWQRMEQWVAIDLDGVQIQRFAVARGTSEMQIFGNMNPGQLRDWHVRIVRENQSEPGDDQQYLAITALRVEGVEQGSGFTPVEPYARRIEFIGDSITTGEGATGARGDNDWSSVFFSYENSYANLVGRALNADVRVCSQSGWGLRADWRNDRANRIPLIYEKVCGASTGEPQQARGSQDAYDFSSWQPQAVVINLGTNDRNGFRMPALADTTSKLEPQPLFKEHQAGERELEESMWVNADIAGQFELADTDNLEKLRDDALKIATTLNADALDIALLQRDAREFVAMVRKNNQTALIVWAFGLYEPEFGVVFSRALEQYSELSGDTNVKFVLLPQMREETTGAHEHPGAKAHQECAQVLVKELKAALKW